MSACFVTFDHDRVDAHADELAREAQGVVDDLRLLFSVGYRVANAEVYPTWSPGSEFKAKREAMLNH